MDDTDRRIGALIGPTPRGVPEAAPDLAEVRRRARTRRTRRRVAAAVASVVVAAGIAIPIATLVRLHHPRPSGSATCPQRWVLQRGAAATAREVVLHDVAAISSQEAWAVGNVEPLSPALGPGHFHLSEVRILHWDGNEWVNVPVPQPSWTYREEMFQGSPTHVTGGTLEAVDATVASDVWAVGNGVGPFSMHWDGTRWSIVRFAAPPGQKPGVGRVASVNDVVAIAPDDAWAVGERPLANGHVWPLFEHWDGRSWHLVDPDPGTVWGSLWSVTATSPSNLWAVGDYALPDSDSRPLIMHWGGKGWQFVPGPHRGRTGKDISYFRSVAARSTSDTWAVGAGAVAGGRLEPFDAHWDGHRWSVVPMPAFPSSATIELSGVAFGPKGTAWVVGSQSAGELAPGGSFDIPSMLVLRWDGLVWRVVQEPPVVPRTNPPQYKGEVLEAVTISPSGQLWAVGDRWVGANHKALIELGCGMPPATP